ncbi:MAG: nuclear transport factor 2 family protein [Alphaproteobacteria bacterium]|nr:nuclear transport factor 2 family protein [Alphaproteobacteria bacterium]
MALTAGQIAQGQLDAYNVQNLDRFCAYYADDVVIADYRGTENCQGLAALRDRYAKVFAEFPGNQVVLLGRIILGNTVIDHEEVRRAPDAVPFYVAAIYTIAGGKIARCEFVKA